MMHEQSVSTMIEQPVNRLKLTWWDRMKGRKLEFYENQGQTYRTYTATIPSNRVAHAVIVETPGIVDSESGEESFRLRVFHDGMTIWDRYRPVSTILQEAYQLLERFDIRDMVHPK